MNGNTSQALVRNFLLVNNFATWFLVLQRLLLHFFSAFNITTQFTAPPKKQWSENLVLQRFLLHCVCVFRGGGLGWVILPIPKKKRKRTHNGVRTTAVPEIRFLITILLFKLYISILLHWKSLMFSFLPPVMQLYLCRVLMTLFTYSLLDQLKCSSNVTKNMYILECNNFDDTLILNSS
jgi:hypothetical protein